MSSCHKVKIAARLRPRINGELDDESVKVFHSSEDSCGSSDSGGGSYITVTNPRDLSQVFKFPFTSCYDHTSTQEEIFLNDVQPMVDVVYSGVTVTIFAYGVTSSGKTHTMQGTKSDPGVIPRVVREMFLKKAQLNISDVSLLISYMEIYKDDVYDLLVTRENAPKLPVRENDAGQVFVANLSREPIASVEEFDTLYSRATKHRSVGSTNLNHASSRSHAVLTIEVSTVDSAHNKTLTGKINLVDLAGSENNKLTGNDPSRMAESSAINKSLSVLGQVVHALNQGASRIPYRNSKLTRILQDALGGSSIGLLICNLAPGVKFRQDTLNTLNFAVRTKNIENKPVINERDNRVQPKPHFAANPVPAPKLAPAVLQPSGSGSGSGSKPNSSRANSARPSLVPNPSGRPRAASRVPRVSAFSGAGMGFQPFALPKGGAARMSIGGLLSEQEIDERISKAVEAEVARRMEEREKERVEEGRRVREEEEPTAPRHRSPKNEQTLPSGVLTPLLKRHRDLDDELKNRLQELERKFERGNKEVQLADVLSPAAKKKTGRAYVALARAHSEKGDLQVALDLYRKAENYVPDNVKLKERIIEIQWAVKNGKDFVPSPKRGKAKKKGTRRSTRSSSLKPREYEALNGASESQMDVDDDWRDEEAVEDEIIPKRNGKGSGSFGVEVTNSPGKRSVVERGKDDETEDVQTPPKRQKRANVRKKRAAVVEVSSEDEWAPPVPRMKNGKKAGTT